MKRHERILFAHRDWFHFPRLELLEKRLPPGNVMFAGNGVTYLLDRPTHAPSSAQQSREKFMAVQLDVLERSAPPFAQKKRTPANFETPPHPGALLCDGIAATENGCLQVEELLKDLLGQDAAAAVGASGHSMQLKSTSGSLSPPDGTEDLCAALIGAPNNRASLSVATNDENSRSARPVPPALVFSRNEPQPVNDTQTGQMADQLGEIPLSFEENVGQFDDRVDFVSRRRL